MEVTLHKIRMIHCLQWPILKIFKRKNCDTRLISVDDIDYNSNTTLMFMGTSILPLKIELPN